MNKYEKRLLNILELYDEMGLWIEDDSCKIGFSYIEIEKFENGHNPSFEIIRAENNKVPIYEEYYLEELMINLDEKFVITKDKAIEGNFVSWDEFKKAVDGEISIDILSV